MYKLLFLLFIIYILINSIVCVNTNMTSLESDVNRLIPGTSNTAVRLWSLYLPHKIPSWMYTENIDCDNFTVCIAYVGHMIGFNLSLHTTNDGVYVGPAMTKHTGVLNVSNDKMYWKTPYDIMSMSPLPKLGATSIRVIDNINNRMCPCQTVTEKCSYTSSYLPMRCVSNTTKREYDDLYLVSLFFIICVLAGTGMLIIRDMNNFY